MLTHTHTWFVSRISPRCSDDGGGCDAGLGRREDSPHAALVEAGDEGSRGRGPEAQAGPQRLTDQTQGTRASPDICADTRRQLALKGNLN